MSVAPGQHEKSYVREIAIASYEDRKSDLCGNTNTLDLARNSIVVISHWL